MHGGIWNECVIRLDNGCSYLYMEVLMFIIEKERRKTWKIK